MDVSVIMINYNTFDLTKAAIESIFAHTEGISFEVILVDNLSPDGSGERLREIFKNKIIYLQSGGNLGTSKAFNLGLKQASGKYILWLNTDILLKENFIKSLFDYMEDNPQCGICGGNVLDFEGNPTHSFRKNFPDLKTERKNRSIVRIIWNKLFRKPYFDQYNYTGRPMQVGYITGADMMVRTDLFEKVGAFDEDIFMYAEEVEFTWRVVHKTGMKVMSVPDAHILHLEGASFGRGLFSERRFRNSLIGSVKMYAKCYGTDVAIRYLRLMKRATARRIMICALFYLKEKKDCYRVQNSIIKEYLDGFPKILEH